MQSQPRNRRSDLRRVPRALEEDELHQLGELLNVLPQMELGQLIAADDPEELIVGKRPPKVPGRIDRETHPALLQLVVGNLEATIPLHRRHQHRQPIGGGRLNLLRLQWSLRGGDKEQPVQAVLLVRVLRGDQVSKVDRVKAASEETNLHKLISLNRSPRAGKWRITRRAAGTGKIKGLSPPALTEKWRSRFLSAMIDVSAASPAVKYKRIVLKLSGEVLRGKSTDPIDPAVLERICEQIKEIHDLGVQIGVVIGGGNIFRGLSGERKGVDRTTGDYMGMLATVINSLALMDCLEKMGVTTRVQSAIPMNQVAEPFILRRAIRHVEKGRVVIFAAGTGNPYFSTDTTAALRASEMHADIIMKATKVDGIYDKDPKKHSDAVRYDEITYVDALRQRLNVMDSTAFSLCLDNQVPILVFDLNAPHAIRRAVLGEKIGTLVRG